MDALRTARAQKFSAPTPLPIRSEQFSFAVISAEVQLNAARALFRLPPGVDPARFAIRATAAFDSRPRPLVCSAYPRQAERPRYQGSAKLTLIELLSRGAIRSGEFSDTLRDFSVQLSQFCGFPRRKTDQAPLVAQAEGKSAAETDTARAGFFSVHHLDFLGKPRALSSL